MTYVEVARLREAWAQEHPDRARGGVLSVAGFAYQFHSALRDAVAAFLADGSGIGPVVEAVSDVVAAADHDTWRITQVKTTGSSSSVSRALDELWSIDEVARQTAPELWWRLRYEIRCARWELADVEGTVRRWSSEPGDSARAREVFARRVSTTTDPDPLSEAVVLLANELHARDPVGWAHEWVGRMAQAATTRRDPFDVGRELFSALGALRNQLPETRLPGAIEVVPVDFQEPPETVAGRYLVGEQPRLIHLQQGYFAPREWQVGPAFESFVEWYAQDPFAIDIQRRLPVFWIAGRSGSGKSTLLLQVVARLAQSGQWPVLWLGNRRGALIDAVRLGLEASAKGTQPIVVIDDPYAPAEQGDVAAHWSRALDELAGRRDNVARVPIILACGPTEHGEALARDLASDVSVHFWTLDDSLDESNLDGLLGWFEARSGARAPDVGRGDILMVQRFFEWRTGEPLVDFAKRFRGRVEALAPGRRLIDLISQLLTVNRFYAGLPTRMIDSLSDVERDALRILERDHHLAVDEHDGRPGLWLTHPHLCEALYQAWYPPAATSQRSGSLRDAILAGREHGETPADQTRILWALARARIAGPDDPMAVRLDVDETAMALRAACRRWAPAGQRMPFVHLPAWVHVRGAFDLVDLTPDPLREALDQLTPERVREEGVQVVCHSLLDVLDDVDEAVRTDALAKIRSCLDENANWFGFPYVAVNLAYTTGLPEDARRLITWALANTLSPLVPMALRAAIACKATSAEAQHVAASLAMGAPGDFSWAQLFERILQNDCPAYIVGWTRAHVTSRHVVFVLQRLLERAHPDAPELCREWLRAWPESPVSNYLIERLVRRTEPQELEQDLARRWITLGYAAADRLIEWVIKTDGWSDAVRDPASQWLERYPDARGWPFVLQRVLDAATPEDRGHYVSLGMRWLDGREHLIAWTRVAQALFDVANDESRRDLAETSILWLESHGEDVGWPFLLQRVLPELDDPEARSHVVAKGIEWLAAHADSASWGYLAEMLVRVAGPTQKAQLVRPGLAWLEGREDEPGWTSFFPALAAGAGPHADVAEVGIRWLNGRDRHPKLSRVLRSLSHAVATPEQRALLVRVGHEWLCRNPTRQDWPLVMTRMLRVADNDQQAALVTDAVGWLESVRRKRHWAALARAVLDVADPDTKSRLFTPVAQWLWTYPVDAEWRSLAWGVLVAPIPTEGRRRLESRIQKVAPLDERLMELVEQSKNGDFG